MNVVLIGMKHCGKTTIGQALARRWECGFADIDPLMEAMHACDKNEHLSVREILSKYGEEHFRRMEGMVISDLYMKMEQSGTQMVVAVGGRTALNDTVNRLLDGIGPRVCLEVAPDELWRRIQQSGIPPWLDAKNPERAFRKLCDERLPHYRALADVVIAVDGLTPQEAAARISEALDHLKS
jgi:shikimate kinase